MFYFHSFSKKKGKNHLLVIKVRKKIWVELFYNQTSSNKALAMFPPDINKVLYLAGENVAIPKPQIMVEEKDFKLAR